MATILEIARVGMGENGLAFGAVSEVDEGEMDGSKPSYLWKSPPLFHSIDAFISDFGLFDVLVLQVVKK